MDSSTWMVVVSVLTALVTAITAAVMSVLRTRHELANQQRRTDTDDRERIIDRQETQILRYQEQHAEDEKALRLFGDAIAEYREELAEIRSRLEVFVDIAKAQMADLKAAGQPTRSFLPDVPKPRKHLLTAQRIEFELRTTNQNTRSLRALDQALSREAIPREDAEAAPGGTPP